MKTVKYILTVGALLLLLTISGCQSPASDTEPAGGSEDNASSDDSSGEATSEEEIITISFMQWWGTEGNVGESLEGLVADFEAENPNIEVELVSLPFGETKTQIVANHAAGTVADVIGVNPPWTREFYDLGILEPLDEYMDSDPNFNREDYFPASMAPIDGNTYLAPYNTLSFFLYYNIDMFEEAGLEPPQTWDEIVSSAIALTDIENNQYGFTLSLSEGGAANGSILSLYPLLYAANGRTLVDGQYTVETPEMRMAMELLAELSEAGAIVPGENVRNDAIMVEEFSLGNVGMMIQNDAHVATLAASNPDLNYGVIPIPTPDGTGEPELRHHGWDIAMTAKGEHKEAAWMFISYLLQRENMERAGIEMQKTPSMYDVPLSDDASPQEIAIREYLSTYDMVEELMSMPNASASWAELTEAGVIVLNGQASVDDALANTQAEWDAILEQ